MTRKEMFLSLAKPCAFFVAITVFLTSCGGDSQQQGAMPTQVETFTVALDSMTLYQSYPATIKGKTDIEIRPQITGFITKVHVDEGQVVKKGQVLFTIDQVQYEAAVRSAEAAVAAAESQVATARLTEENQKKLHAKNIISDYEYETAVLSLRSAEANLNQARASLVNAQRNLDFTEVVAPSDGVIGTIPNREGALVGPSSATALTTVSDISEVYAYFSLNEKDIINMSDNGSQTINEAIKEMPEVYFEMSNGSRYPLPGKVSTVSGVLDGSTGTASVRALFKNTNSMLRSGSTGQILVPQPSKDLLIIPQKATYEIQDRVYVYLVNDSSKAVATNITVSPVNDGQTYIVNSGLKVGDVIVTEGVGTSVRAGTLIQPRNASAAQQ